MLGNVFESLIHKPILARRRHERDQSHPLTLPPISRSLSINQFQSPDKLKERRKTMPSQNQMMSINESITDYNLFNRRLVLYLHQKSNGLKLALAHIVQKEKQKQRNKNYRSHSEQKVSHLKEKTKPTGFKIKELRVENIQLGNQFHSMENRRREHILRRLKNKRESVGVNKIHNLEKGNQRYVLACEI